MPSFTKAIAALKELVAPRSDKTPPEQVLRAILSGLEADGYKIEPPSRFSTSSVGPFNEEVTKHLVGTGPPYKGTSTNNNPPLGCFAQVKRSEKGVDFDALRKAELPYAHPPRSFKGIPSSTAGPACRCVISEHGLIDNSLCRVEHSLASIPSLTRWYVDSESMLHGMCVLPGWSGWAGPAVMGLLGRRADKDDVLALWKRSHPKTRHDSKFLCRLAYVADCGTPVYHLTLAPPGANTARRFSQILRDLPKGSRVGQQPPEESGSSNSTLAPTWIDNPAPIAALGGVRQVPTSIVATQISPAAESRWHANFWPEKVSPETTTWTQEAAGTRINVARNSGFRYFFPETLNQAREPFDFTEVLESTWMRRIEVDAASTVAASYRRSFKKEKVDRTIISAFSAIARVLDNDLSLDTLKEADAMEGYSRAMGSRGQRFAPNWKRISWRGGSLIATLLSARDKHGITRSSVLELFLGI